MTADQIRELILANINSITVDETPDGIVVGFNSDEIEIALSVIDVRNVD